ncbi:hypothetical protein ACFYZJ_07230 [Streptomyces sp. NPDC001848]|uniref:hypothetical protein n=1 Tax=Streptomyces sp. NPDC001848 TaxID=3364618 RepID=UPI0036A5CA76
MAAGRLPHANPDRPAGLYAVVGVAAAVMLASVPVRRAMTPDPATVPAATTIREVQTGPPWEYRHSAFPVTHAAGHPWV